MKRILSLLVVLGLVSSMFIVPVSATFGDGTNHAPTISFRDVDSVSLWTSYWDSKVVNLGDIGDFDVQMLWSQMDITINRAVPGEKDTFADLAQSTYSMSFWWASLVSDLFGLLTANYKHDVWDIQVNIGYDEEFGVYRPFDVRSGLPIVNSAGQFPYWIEPEDTGDEDSSSLGGRWILEELVDGSNVPKHVTSEAFLGTMAVGLNNSGDPGNRCRLDTLAGTYKDIETYPDSEGDVWVYCDSAGRPYVSRLDDDQWAQDDENNYYVDDDDGDGIYDDGETENNTLIDLDSNMVWLPDGTFNFINNLIYDESTKTYFVDAHSEYDIENNVYLTFNYHYEYHIDYTSITYIGATEEYSKTYELYYQLPDGRSSADLTAEELLALNVAVDVVPYIRSADDTSIRALYHFDGDCLDDSYWNYLGELIWNQGASITYMEANAFNGALYLDETVHDFTIKLPSNIYSGDFTMQFRYYQSHTEAPVTDSYIQIGANKLLQMSGSHFYNGSGTALAQTPVGSWNEVCLMRRNNTIYVFLNGVRIGSYADGTVYGSDIRFYFGTEQQTYKYFDEFRFVSTALYDTSGYTPTSVPFDTNLALVLPDSIIPVADEYWSISSSKENLLSDYGLDYGGQAWLDSSYFTARSTGYAAYQQQDSWPNWAYISDFTSFLADTGSFSMQYHEPPDASVYPQHGALAPFNPIVTYLYSNTRMPASGIFTRISTYSAPSDTTFLPAGDYTLSLVFDDGEVVSNTFNVASYFSSDLISSHGVKFGIQQVQYDEGKYWGYLRVYPESEEYSSGIVYMELVEGTSTDLTAEKVSSIAGMDAKQFKTPTLAVRTDLDITGYQIGGVRPSLPDKGLVWALVEDGRITSLQIYNGQAWEAVDGRIWTGSRWVPYYAYDVLLLKDLYDIVESDPSLDYIYTEAGFWAWLQKAWGQMMTKLDQIILALGGNPNASTCAHVYNSKVDREPGCTEPGYRTYTCKLCGHTYTELIDANGHDWVVINSVPDVLDEEGNLVEEGYDELTCTVCGAESRDYGDGPEEQDIFDALGDFIADGIGWILEKLTELADSLQQITDIFNGFVEKVKALAGGYPMFFGAFMALIPEDLATVLWFAVIAFVVLCVWKKWTE